MLARVLRIFWALMAAAVAVIVLRRGPDARTVAACLFYATGWLLLSLALTRDREAAELRMFARSAAARVAGGAGLLLLLAVALAASVPAMLETLLALAVSALALWSAQPRASALARTVGRLLLVAGTFGMSLAAGETVFRLPSVYERTGAGVPGTHRWQREHFDALAKQSMMSFRSLHADHPKSKDAFRILALGDSFTWGVGIPHTEDVWPYVLERNLQPSVRPIEVINAGIPTYTTVNEAEVLATRGWSFELDVVALEFTLNDALPSGPNFFRRSDDWFFGTAHLIPLLHQVLHERSYFYSFLDGRFQALQMQRHPSGFTPLYEENYDGWRACRAALRDMAAACRQRQVRMVLMLFPFFVPGRLDEASYPYLEIHRKVMAAAEQAGIPALDLQPLFARFNRDGSSWWALPNDAHPNVEAHRLAGEALAGKLRELNWLPSPANTGTR